MKVPPTTLILPTQIMRSMRRKEARRLWVWYRTNHHSILVVDAYVESAWYVVIAAVTLGIREIEVLANV